MTQELYQAAMKFAGEKHQDQKVPGTNANYLLHLSNVAMEVLMAHCNDPNFNLNIAIQIAILHDTLEDTDTDFGELETNFGISVAEAVRALTKDSAIVDKKQRMMGSLKRINGLPKEVGLVKIADRITNLQPPPAHWSPQKIENYLEEAQLISQTLNNKHSYLNQRLEDKILEYATFMKER